MTRFAHLARLAVVLLLVATSATADSLADALAAIGREDYATALRLLRPLAEKGNAEAQLELGLMYRDGNGVPQDAVAGAQWMLRSAEQGHPPAQFFVAGAFLRGRGVPEDEAKAAEWMLRAAKQGDPDAQSDLGMFYAMGVGVPRDDVQAYLWFHLAATRFDPSRTQRIQIAESNRDHVASRMTAGQIAEAQRLAREWKPKPETPIRK
jgi:hypothetical protein